MLKLSKKNILEGSIPEQLLLFFFPVLLEYIFSQLYNTIDAMIVGTFVGKAINMAKEVNKPIVGLIENMAYVKCDECGHEIQIYNNDETASTAEKYGLEVLGKLPIDPVLANFADDGEIESYNGAHLEKLVNKL